MKTRISPALLALAFFATLNSQLAIVFAQGAAFTYQGRFTDNSQPFTGIAEMQLTLWDAMNAGTAVATNSPPSVFVAVTNGLFTVSLDFGAGTFDGSPRYLQIDVRTVLGPFTTLSPRQAITSAPYALRAANVSANGLASGTYESAITLSNTNNAFAGTFNGTVSGNGSALNSVNATTLGGQTAASFWRRAGNAGTTPGTHFVGTTDNQPLELRVNNQRALRLQPTASNDTVNVVGGSARNFVAPGVAGGTIAGGGSGDYLGATYTNSVMADFGTVSGGVGNAILATSFTSAIAGGEGNSIGTNSAASVIGGGSYNSIAAGSYAGAINGGSGNTIGTNSQYSTVGGGLQNSLGNNSQSSAIVGGAYNVVGNRSTYSAVVGGLDNNIGTNSGYSLVGAGYNNNIADNSDHSIIVGGRLNDIGTNSAFSAIGGGYLNRVIGRYSTIAGGSQNSTSNNYATVVGGLLNICSGSVATVGGGYRNTNSGGYATIAGGQVNSSSGEFSAIGGGWNNSTASAGATAGGGFNNFIEANAAYSTISGGDNNIIHTNAYSTAIGGGEGNEVGAGAYDSTISGGASCTIQNGSHHSTIGGGRNNTIQTNAADNTIAGGAVNSIRSRIASGATTGGAAIGGGAVNVIDEGADYATIPGGNENIARGALSFAAGNRALAQHANTFVWGGGTTTNYASTAAGTFNVYSVNGVSFDYNGQRGDGRGNRWIYFGALNAGNTIVAWNGARLSDAGVWASVSDRNRKTDFAEINARQILERVATLAVRQWRYTNESVTVKHIGPTAQDFKAAFGLGDDDKSIGTVDADGVALAAIQALNQKLEEQRAENHELKKRLVALEQLVFKLKANRQSDAESPL